MNSCSVKSVVRVYASKHICKKYILKAARHFKQLSLSLKMTVV